MSLTDLLAAFQKPLRVMSDFEDDGMDIDAPAGQHDIQFSSSNADRKGKRTVADLPIEAGDTLPW